MIIQFTLEFITTNVDALGVLVKINSNTLLLSGSEQAITDF